MIAAYRISGKIGTAVFFQTYEGFWLSQNSKNC